RYCYDQARNIRDPDADPVQAGKKPIAHAVKIPKRFPLHDAAERKTPLFPDAALGLRISKNGKSYFYICQDRLGLARIREPRMKRLVIEKGKDMRLIIPSKNTSSSVQIRVMTSQGEVKKPRFWRLRRDRTLAWAAQHP
ncbi:MAG: hypothetical protein ACREYF_00010, partial [Gammaproteobacteria bacterium]